MSPLTEAASSACPLCGDSESVTRRMLPGPTPGRFYHPAILCPKQPVLLCSFYYSFGHEASLQRFGETKGKDQTYP